MYGYIYITENLINHRKYIGQHKSESFDPDYKGSGTLLFHAFKKHGWDNFKTEILEWCQSKEELDGREIYWISYHNAVEDPMFYNLAKGGEGGIGGPHCFLYGEANPMYGRPWTERQLELQRLSHLGHRDSEETKKKKSEAGKKRWTAEMRKEAANKMTGGKNWLALSIVCVETSQVFETVAAAGEFCGLVKYPYFISRKCRNHRGEAIEAGGYHWMLYEDWIKLQEQEGAS